MSQTTTKPETAPKAKRGFGLLPCPCCGEAEVYIQAQVSDLTGDDAFHCASCDADFGPDVVRAVIAKWAPVLAWIDQAPVLED